MTLIGKVTVINSLLASQLIYVGTVFHTPKWVLKKYNEIILDFLWDKKPPKVKYSNIINSTMNGGLKLQDIESKLKAIKVKWLHAICDDGIKSAWKKYLSTHFNEEIKQILLQNKTCNDYPQFRDKFYQEIFELWAELHNNNPTNSEQACKQLICNNSYIRINGMPITEKTWKFKNIRFIQNLLDTNGKIDTKENLDKKFNVQIETLLLNSVTSAIPHDWKKMIKDDTNSTNYFVFADFNILVNDTYKKLIEVKTNEVYQHLITKIAKRATSEAKWEEETGINYDEEQWEQAYSYPYQLTRDVKILSFHYKITHRILACKRNLKTWKIKNDNICDVCTIEMDGIEHHLIACPVLLDFWSNLFTWWKAVSKMAFPIDTYDILFGIPNPNNDIIIYHMNYLILHALYYIYVTKITSKTPKLFEYVLVAKRNLDMLKTNMENKGLQKKYNARWAPLADSI
jgi:hypothetical protein